MNLKDLKKMFAELDALQQQYSAILNSGLDADSLTPEQVLSLRLLVTDLGYAKGEAWSLMQSIKE